MRDSRSKTRSDDNDCSVFQVPECKAPSGHRKKRELYEDDQPRWYKDDNYVRAEGDLGCTLCGKAPVVVLVKGKAHSDNSWTMGAGYCARCAIIRFNISESRFASGPIQRADIDTAHEKDGMDASESAYNEEVRASNKAWDDQLLREEEELLASIKQAQAKEAQAERPVSAEAQEAEDFLNKHTPPRSTFHLNAVDRYGNPASRKPGYNQHHETHLRYEAARKR